MKLVQIASTARALSPPIQRARGESFTSRSAPDPGACGSWRAV
jgi:hypothetical protein